MGASARSPDAISAPRTCQRHARCTKRRMRETAGSDLLTLLRALPHLQMDFIESRLPSSCQPERSLRLLPHLRRFALWLLHDSGFLVHLKRAGCIISSAQPFRRATESSSSEEEGRRHLPTAGFRFALRLALRPATPSQGLLALGNHDWLRECRKR
jgi:hypothetical protein